MQNLEHITGYKHPLLVFFAVLLFLSGIWSQLATDSGMLNLHAHQADAFLHGRTDIAPQQYDAAIVDGKYYVPYPPAPSLLLMPFVAIFGLAGTKVILVCLLLTILNIFVLRSLLIKLDTDETLITWLIMAFITGTGYWMVLRYTSTVYYYAHIVAVSALLLALNEAFGKGRGWLVAVFLGLAILSRQLVVYSTVFFLVLLWQQSATGSRRWANLAGFLSVLALFMFAYLGFNWVRFGSPLDTGYGHIEFTPFLKLRIEKYGLFHYAYVPFNFINLFLQGFHINFSEPLLLRITDMDHFGTSITFASPFVFAAFWARGNKPLLWAAWSSMALTVIHLLFYHNNGWYQINAQRFTLDFLPLLMVLVVMGARRTRSSLLKGAIIYSIALNVLALVLVPWVAFIFNKLVKA